MRQFSKGSALLSRAVLPRVSLLGNAVMAIEDWLTPAPIRMDNAVVYVVFARPTQPAPGRGERARVTTA